MADFLSSMGLQELLVGGSGVFVALAAVVSLLAARKVIAIAFFSIAFMAGALYAVAPTQMSNLEDAVVKKAQDSEIIDKALEFIK